MRLCHGYAAETQARAASPSYVFPVIFSETANIHFDWLGGNSWYGRALSVILYYDDSHGLEYVDCRWTRHGGRTIRLESLVSISPRELLQRQPARESPNVLLCLAPKGPVITHPPSPKSTSVDGNDGCGASLPSSWSRRSSTTQDPLWYFSDTESWQDTSGIIYNFPEACQPPSPPSRYEPPSSFSSSDSLGLGGSHRPATKQPRYREQQLQGASYYESHMKNKRAPHGKPCGRHGASRPDLRRLSNHFPEANSSKSEQGPVNNSHGARVSQAGTDGNELRSLDREASPGPIIVDGSTFDYTTQDYTKGDERLSLTVF
jgi:hypothetical protein